MKKFALLGAVAALATAGGVFAAWTFSNATKPTVDNDPSLSVSVDLTHNYTAYGTLTETANTKFVGVIKEKEDSTTNNATIDFAEGSYKLDYAAFTDGDATITTSDIKIGAAWTGEKTRVFKIGEETIITITLEDFDDETVSAGGNYTITQDELESKISFEGTIDSYSELTQFNTWVKTLTFGIEVSVK